MSVKYPVKEVNYTALVLDDTTVNILLEYNNKKVIARSLSLASNSFAYDGKNKYRFGCEKGAFNYKQLLEQIEAAESVFKAEVDALIPNKGGNAITTEIADESDKYYILKGGKAVLKENYTKGKTTPKAREQAFGSFKYQSDGWGDKYYYWGTNRAGSYLKEILETMLKAKAVIDFIEEKGDYAPLVEEKVEEVVA